MPSTRAAVRTATLTILALVAFAANSILGRLALGPGAIDAASYSTIRLASGAVFLAALVSLRGGHSLRDAGSWPSAAMLFAYAAPFAFAYRTLPAGTGALILFAAVQVTMIAAGLRSGERPPAVVWTGLLLALGGLAWLVRPGLSAPSPVGTALMAAAGAAWGVYSLRGRRSASPLRDTAGNFVRSVLPALVVSAAAAGTAHATPRGALLAFVSGAITSGAGYAIWYAALPGLTAVRAGIVQLAVPVLAAGGGALLLGERVTVRLLMASAAILGGVAMAITGRGTRPAPATPGSPAPSR